jgi:hypothetical protein
MTASRYSVFGAIQTELPSHIAAVPLVSLTNALNTKWATIWAYVKHLTDFLKSSSDKQQPTNIRPCENTEL